MRLVLALMVWLDAGPAVFDDAELKRLLREEPRFVVCIWSPHMPLSVDAVREVTAAGAELKLAVVCVLDPRADRDYAAATAASLRLPADVLRRAQAARLMRADAFQHSPAVVVFAHGRQVGPPILGFRDAPGYEQILRRRLAELH